MHTLAEEATALYEACRRAGRPLRQRAASERGVVIVRNATEAINLVARSWGATLAAGDEVLLSEMEHHSNLVPWIMLARERGVVLRARPDHRRRRARHGRASIAARRARTRIVALTAMSNVLGTINPIAEIADGGARRGRRAGRGRRAVGAPLPVDFQALGADFLAFSAHKMYGPTGVGFLVAKPELLERMEPVAGGGEMIREVRLDWASWNDIPHKFEAGTPEHRRRRGVSRRARHARGARHGRRARPRARARRPTRSTGSAASAGSRSTARSIPTAAAAWSRSSTPRSTPTTSPRCSTRCGIAVRAGHHCAQPLMRRLGVAATARASFGLYNDRDDVDALVDGLRRGAQVLRCGVTCAPRRFGEVKS